MDSSTFGAVDAVSEPLGDAAHDALSAGACGIRGGLSHLRGKGSQADTTPTTPTQQPNNGAPAVDQNDVGDWRQDARRVLVDVGNTLASAPGDLGNFVTTPCKDMVINAQEQAFPQKNVDLAHEVNARTVKNVSVGERLQMPGEQTSQGLKVA